MYESYSESGFAPPYGQEPTRSEIKLIVSELKRKVMFFMEKED